MSTVNVSSVSLRDVPIASALKTEGDVLLKELTDLLNIKELPKTKEDAVALYHALTLKLGKYLVSKLPEVEQKAATVAMWLVGEAEAEFVDCIPSWNCATVRPK